MDQNNNNENKTEHEMEVNGIKVTLKFSDKPNPKILESVTNLLIKSYESRVTGHKLT